MSNFNTIQLHLFSFETKQHLVLKRSEHLRIYPGIWQVITGKIEENESALIAANREMFEETSLRSSKIYNVPYIGQYFNHRRNMIMQLPVFAASVEDLSILSLSTEHDEYKILSKEEAIELVELPSHKEGIDAVDKYIINNKNRNIYEIK